MWQAERNEQERESESGQRSIYAIAKLASVCRRKRTNPIGGRRQRSSSGLSSSRPRDRSTDRSIEPPPKNRLPPCLRSVCSNAPTARIARVAFVLPHPIYSCGEVI